jgi:LacI family transcriptional regulator
MPAERVTLIHVARAAGVSPSTASRALHGGARVAPHLVARVRTAAQALGYRLNPQAKTLRTGRDSTIGLVVEDFNVALFAGIASSVAAAARERGVQVVISTFGTGGAEPPAVEALASRNVGGMIVVEGGAGAAYLAGIARDQPTVVVDAARPHVTVDTVTVDNHGGALQATRRLLDRGHARIAFVGSTTRAKTVHRRFEGYAQALTEAGLAVDPDLVLWAGLSRSEALPVVVDRLNAWGDVTAVFSSVIRATPALLTALVQQSRRDVEVMSFDDVDLFDVVSPPISALAQDAEAIGREATRLLFDRIDGFNGPARHVEVPLQLIDRSTAQLTGA